MARVFLRPGDLVFTEFESVAPVAQNPQNAERATAGIVLDNGYLRTITLNVQSRVLPGDAIECECVITGGSGVDAVRSFTTEDRDTAYRVLRERAEKRLVEERSRELHGDGCCARTEGPVERSSR